MPAWTATPCCARMYPDDLTEPRRHLALFLAQYWGGPTVYNEERGHPRLRMRHARFVGRRRLPPRRGCGHMTAAVDAADMPPEDRPNCSTTCPWRRRA